MAAMVCFSTHHGVPGSCYELELGQNSSLRCNSHCYTERFAEISTEFVGYLIVVCFLPQYQGRFRKLDEFADYNLVKAI